MKQIFANNDLVATIERNGTTTTAHYVHDDHLGGSSVISNSTGNLEQTLDYYPFGGIRFNLKTGSFDEQRKYTGHEYDKETGLNYMGARYQNGSVGRFMSEDPAHLAIGDSMWVKQTTGRDMQAYLSDPQALNSYSYARNNPLLYTDPNGKAFGIDDIAGLVVGGLVGGSMQIGTSLVTHQPLTWGGVAGAATAGAIVGWGTANAPETLGASLGVSAEIAGAVLYGGIGSAAGNTIKQTIDLSTGDQQGGLNAKELGFNTAFGAISGGLTEGVLPEARIPGFSSGRGNMNAIGKSLETKMANGVVKNMSFNTAIKSAVGSQSSNAYKTLGTAAMDFAKNVYNSSNIKQDDHKR